MTRLRISLVVLAALGTSGLATEGRPAAPTPPVVTDGHAESVPAPEGSRGHAAENVIVAYRIINGREIRNSLTADPGDAVAGRKLYFDLDRTGCSGCHGSPGGPGAQSLTSAAPGPDLAGVAARLTPGQIRLWIVAPEALRPGTAMPGYYLQGQRRGAHDSLFGGPRLTAPQIEDLVAYLALQTDSD